MMYKQLFKGPMVHLAAVDPERDGAVEASWTYDLDYARDLRLGPVRPLGAPELKKRYDEQAKKAALGSQFYFGIRRNEDDELVGFLRFPNVFWTHAAAIVVLAFADAGILSRYGAEVLGLALCYAFRELNLYRIETILPAYKVEAIALFEGAGFLMEVRRRAAIYRDGRAWDLLHFGILRDEWKTREEEALAL
jgi:RimJ/RimL family protein N-acetyltransferase